MANTFSTTDLVAREVLAIAHQKSNFLACVDQQWDKSYFKVGAQAGSSLRVKYPFKPTLRRGRVMAVSDVTDRTGTITFADTYGADLAFNSNELMFSTENPKEVAKFSKRFIEPAVDKIIANIEADMIAYVTKKVSNVAGTAGTAITDLSVPGIAQAKLNQNLADQSNRYAFIDSVTMASIVNGRAAYFNPVGDISKNYREGQIGRNAMADWYANESMWTLQNGSDVTISTDAAALVVDGTAALDFHTLTAAQVAIGAVFTIAGVYDCNPETKARYPHLKQWTLVSGGATTGASVISPTIYLTGPEQNCCSSTGAALTPSSFNAQVMTFVGLASTGYVQGLMFQKNAFQFVSADMPIVSDAASCTVRNQEGLSFRVWQGSDIRNDQPCLMRIDITCGFAALQPEFACRLIGSAL